MSRRTISILTAACLTLAGDDNGNTLNPLAYFAVNGN